MLKFIYIVNNNTCDQSRIICQNIFINETLTFTITATDPDGDKLSFRIENAPSGASINSNSGAFSWKPSKAGSYSATAVVTDDGSPSQNDKQTFNITVNPATCPTQSQIPNTECNALVAIYNETGGPNWRSGSNWTKTNTPCSWDGIACSGGRVTSLNLYYKNLTGILPDLSALTALKSLNLENNQLTQVPNLSDLTALETLNLQSNIITQVHDFSRLTALKTLNVASNSLTVVPDFSNLTTLESLYLNSNQLTQAPDFSNLSSLSAQAQMMLKCKREQIFYPCPADMSALGKFELTPKGILEFEIDGQKFKGRLDYQVKQGKATEIADSNDVMITYPNGTEQRLFALPE